MPVHQAPIRFREDQPQAQEALILRQHQPVLTQQVPRPAVPAQIRLIQLHLVSLVPLQLAETKLLQAVLTTRQVFLEDRVRLSPQLQVDQHQAVPVV